MLERKAVQAASFWPLQGKLEHAFILVESPEAKNHDIKDDHGHIKVMYNPEDLTLSQHATVDGVGNNVYFSRTDPDDLVVTLFFDSYEDRTDIRLKTNQILSLTEPWKVPGKLAVPPTVKFMWGSNNLFTGIVTRVDQKFTMFLPSGVPVRADLTVTFKEVLTDTADLRAQGFDNCRRLWTVSATDRLDSIAFATLGDRTQWRMIADANGIYNPISFPDGQWVGRTIAIPDTHGESYDPGEASDYV
jgi:hypothetical protein